jgi:hypothetical protein
MAHAGEHYLSGDIPGVRPHFASTEAHQDALYQHLRPPHARVWAEIRRLELAPEPPDGLPEDRLFRFREAPPGRLTDIEPG